MHLGFIIPSSNAVMEEESSKFIAVHPTRIPLRNVDEESLIHDTEDGLKKPVTCRNSALLWNASKLTHKNDTKGKIYLGRLLEEYL